MLRHGRLLRRNESIMLPLVEGGYVTAEQMPILNEIIVDCFQVLLEEKMHRGDALDNMELIERHQTYIRAILGRT